MMLFPHCFWGDRDMFGVVQPDPARRGAYYLFYGYEAVSGGSVLAALVAGQAAHDIEGLGDAEAVGQVGAGGRAGCQGCRRRVAGAGARVGSRSAEQGRDGDARKARKPSTD
jgi:hypothetical protein